MTTQGEPNVGLTLEQALRREFRRALKNVTPGGEAVLPLRGLSHSDAQSLVLRLAAELKLRIEWVLNTQPDVIRLRLVSTTKPGRLRRQVPPAASAASRTGLPREPRRSKPRDKFTEALSSRHEGDVVLLAVGEDGRTPQEITNGMYRAAKRLGYTVQLLPISTRRELFFRVEDIPQPQPVRIFQGGAPDTNRRRH